jgi:hypothetical protein
MDVYGNTPQYIKLMKMQTMPTVNTSQECGELYNQQWKHILDNGWCAVDNYV